MITEAVFEETVKKHCREWQSAAIRVTGNSSDADDIVQNALIDVWKNREAFAGQSTLATYIYRIVVHKAVDWVRSQAARARLMQNLETRTPAPDFRRLYEAIARLPEIYANTVITLLDNDMHYDAAARILECSENLLYTRMHRARLLLKKILKNTFELQEKCSEKRLIIEK